MKKGLIGCLIVGLVIVVVGGGAAYWFVLRPMWNAGSAMVQNAQDMAKVADVEKSVSNQAPFTAPADGKLTPAQVQSFVAVQNLLFASMGKDFDALKQKYDAIEAEHKQDGKDANLGQVMGAYSDLSGLILKARQAQVEGINQQHLSLEEYRWIRQQAYSALPFIEMTPEQVTQMTVPAPAASQMPAAAANIPPDAQQAVLDAQAAMKAATDSPEMQAAKANADLLRPNKELLEKTLGEAWLGM
jgi:hypothetical protein